MPYGGDRATGGDETTSAGVMALSRGDGGIAEVYRSMQSGVVSRRAVEVGERGEDPRLWACTEYTEHSSGG